MGQLQLYLTMSKKGAFAPMLKVNHDEYAYSWVTDLCEIVKQVDYPLSGKSIFYMIKYIDSGAFVVVIRTIPTQPGDNLACWLYIPYTLKVNDDDIVKATEFIAKKAALAEIKKEDVAEIREYFSKEYVDDPNAPIFAPSSGQLMAYRYYGAQYNTAIDTLISQYRYQTSYLPYAGVLLVDCRITSDITGRDLSSTALEQMVTLQAPDPNEEGYEPLIYSQLFDAPYFAPLGRTVDVVWRKHGLPDIVQHVLVSSDGSKCPTPQPSKPANPIADQPATPLSDQPITTPVVQPTTRPADQPSPRPADQPISRPADQPQPKPAPASDLPNRKNTYYFQIPVKSAAIGTVVEFELSTNCPLTESPIEGYEPTGEIREGAAHRNHLVSVAADKNKKLMTNIVWGFCGFLLGILLMLLTRCSGGEGSQTTDEILTDSINVEQTVTETQSAAAENTTKETTNQQQDQAQTPADSSLEAAIAYLDNNKHWKKQELDQYPDLRGLYEDMNNLDREKIVKAWGPKLSESRNFKNVAQHCDMSLKAKKTPKTPGKRATYNTPDDTTISVQGYLNTIDP